MKVTRLREGLWRWVLPHPEWRPENDRPGGWGRFVGSVYYEAPDAVVLIDPLAPEDGSPEAAKFWKALDADVARLARPVVILIGSTDHGRAADRFAARYRKRRVEVEVVGARAIADGVSCELTATLEKARLPRGVEAHRVAGLCPGETAYVLRRPRAVVFADAVIGAGPGRVAVAPISWAVRTPAGRAAYTRAFRRSLGELLDIPPSILLPSHGDPVLTRGRLALERALSAAPWGD